MAKYTMDCPVKGCGQVMEIDADGEDEAVDKLVEAGDAHFAKVDHPMDAKMTPQEKRAMTKKFMKS